MKNLFTGIIAILLFVVVVIAQPLLLMDMIFGVSKRDVVSAWIIGALAEVTIVFVFSGIYELGRHLNREEEK